MEQERGGCLGARFEDLSDIPDADLERMKAIRDAARAKAEHAEMTDTPRRWDRLTAESDPAFRTRWPSRPTPAPQS